MKNVSKINDLVLIKNVIVAVHDERGLEILIPKLLEHCPNVNIIAAHANYPTVRDLISKQKESHAQILSFSQLAMDAEIDRTIIETFQPEVYLGILAKTYCDQHQQLLKYAKIHPIDLIVVNLRPIIVAGEDNDFETAATRIDVAGQAFLSSSVANSRQVMTISSPHDYVALTEEIRRYEGRTSFKARLASASKSASELQLYSQRVADFLNSTELNEASECYELQDTVHDFILAQEGQVNQTKKPGKKIDLGHK